MKFVERVKYLLKAKGPLRILLDFVFPRCCAVCNRKVDSDEYCNLCTSCIAKIPWIDGARCSLCSRPMGDGMIPEEDLICDECKLNPPSFRRGISCWLHRGVGRDIILSLKYRNADFLRDDLANLIKSLRREVSEFASDSLLVPVPMHYFRRIRRGYNQSDVIAEAIAKITNGSTIVNMLKSKHKKSQTQLGREERLTNVRGAFECTSAADSVEKNSRIVLVDDVFTTGATARECCLALQSAGFTNLYVLTLAIG